MNIRFTCEQDRFTKLSCTVANKELPLHLALAALAKPCLYKPPRLSTFSFLRLQTFFELSLLLFLLCRLISLDMRASDVIKRRWALIPLTFILTAFILSMLCIFA